MLSGPQQSYPRESYSTDKQTNNSNVAAVNSEVCTNGNYELPQEECWLYKVPKDMSSVTTPVVPVSKWLRDVFDLPDSPFNQSRRNLLTRLEVILATRGPTAAYRFGGSVPSLNLNHSQSSSYLDQHTTNGGPGLPTEYMSFHQQMAGIPSTGSSESLSSVAHGQLEYATMPGGAHVNNLTFNRIRRPKYSLPPQRSGSQRLAATPSNSTSFLSQSLGGGQINRAWSGSTGKIGSCDALETTKTNVQEIARIQEDILKADVAALVAAAAGRHGSQHSLGSLGRRSMDGSLNQLTSAPGSPSASTTQLAVTASNTNDSCLDEVSVINPSQNVYHNVGSSGGHVVQHPNGSLPVHSNQGSSLGLSYPLTSHYSLDSTDNPSSSYRFGSSHSGGRISYPILPQRPSVPPSYPSEPSEEGISLAPRQSGIPSAIPTEPRTHFGFRPSRKFSTPFFSKPPPLPAEIRRVSTSNMNQTNG